ncbi:hypothetical protein FVE67_00035 [Thermosulfurimonas marina]|uniref:Uncharacterized protein n=1 Tax=Thermosulfurimonas marina TaxID=2047767 RepID=A0A6H1WQ43_9BACT|nr:hypothetical protein [Thermosulfurimonas marina]QJA05278.1 hypothetical protein FVE67_00035 [Thermosulfurimonas marina]
MAIPQKIRQDFPQGLERNTYFFGKLLTAEDFNLEQAYFLAREALINATLLGPGLLWGLGIEDFQVQGEKVRFRITAGLALDTEGRLVLVPEDQTLEIPLKERPDELQIGLFYEECPREPTVTVCDPKECHPNRIREGFRIEIAPKIEPPGVVLARLRKGEEEGYRVLPSERLESLPGLLKKIQALHQELQKLRRECASIPRLWRHEEYFIYQGKPVEIKFGFKALPQMQILSYLPRKYEVSPKPAEEVFRPYRSLIEKGGVLVASHPASEFFRPTAEPPSSPESEAPPRPFIHPGASTRPFILASPALHTFHTLRRVTPETKLKDLPSKARTPGLEIELDPSLNLEIPVGELGGEVFVHFFMYPVFDGTLLPYVNVDF